MRKKNSKKWGDWVRLIDADELKEVAHEMIQEDPEAFNGGYSYNAVTVEEIDEAPTIEAVPVVHCKDCKYRTWFCPGYGCGNYNSPFYLGADEEVPIMTRPDDFCSYGEKNIDKKKG